jgi:hypothetical protein
MHIPIYDAYTHTRTMEISTAQDANKHVCVYTHTPHTQTPIYDKHTHTRTMDCFTDQDVKNHVELDADAWRDVLQVLSHVILIFIYGLMWANLDEYGFMYRC